MMQVSTKVFIPSANFTRPADTNAYATGDLIANNTAAGSVVPLSWIAPRDEAWRGGYGTFYIPAVRLHRSKSDVTNAQFRVHLFSALPTFTSSGDNGVFATVVATGNANWLSSFDVTMVALHADGAAGIAVSTEGAITPVLPASGTVFGLIEARAAYTPSSGEVFTAELLVEQN